MSKLRISNGNFAVGKRKETKVKKEEIKSKLLEPIALKMKSEWHKQGVHKAAVGVFWLDLLGIKDPKEREKHMAAWAATPSSFGANASALGQELGRPKGTRKVEAFAGLSL